MLRTQSGTLHTRYGQFVIMTVKNAENTIVGVSVYRPFDGALIWSNRTKIDAKGRRYNVHGIRRLPIQSVKV